MTMAMTLSDGWTVTRRNLFAMSRNPEVVIWSTIQPIMFIVLFVYVFDSIPTPGLDYVDYVMAGIFVQTVMFNSALTGVGLATDIQKGIIDRFRSLPMARSAVLVGRTTGDIVNGLAQLVVMVVVGFIVGWRTDAVHPVGARRAAARARHRLRVQLDLGNRRAEREVRRGRQLGRVRVDVPGDVRVEHVRRHQHARRRWCARSPSGTRCRRSSLAIRELFGNTSDEMPQPDVWPLQNPVLATFLWLVG